MHLDWSFPLHEIDTAARPASAVATPPPDGSIRRQLRDVRLAVVAGALLVVGVGAAALLMAAAFDRSIYDVTADPNAVADQPFAVGFVSYLGVMGWAATAAVAFVGAGIVTSLDAWSLRAQMLFSGGALSLLLALDDALMLHEVALPEYLFVPEYVVLACYGAAAATFLYRALPVLRSTDFLLLFAAAAALAASIAIDLLMPFNEKVTFAEDLAKFSGIVLWLAYFARTARRMVLDTIAERPRRSAAAR